MSNAHLLTHLHLSEVVLFLEPKDEGMNGCESEKMENNIIENLFTCLLWQYPFQCSYNN